MYVCRFKGCTVRLRHGRLKWCKRHKAVMRKKQLAKAYHRYKKRHGKGLTPKRARELTSGSDVRVQVEPVQELLKPVEALLPAGASLASPNENENEGS